MNFMNIIEKAVEFVVGLLVIGLLVYVGLNLFVAFAAAAFGLSPLTGIGFIVSIVVAFWKENLNLRSMTLIFGGAVVSFAAGSLVPGLLGNIFAGQFLAGAVYLVVILWLYAEAQAVRG